MGLIGQVLGEHPSQEFRDALYEDVFDKHDSTSEVEAILFMHHDFLDREIDGEAVSLSDVTVLDFQVTRIDGNYLPGFEPTEEDERYQEVKYTSYLRKVHEFAMDRIAELDPELGSYVLVHKHPDANPSASAKDRWGAQALVSIDFALNPVPVEHYPDVMEFETRRQFLGLFVMTHEHQDIVAPKNPLPIRNREIDSLNHEKITDITRTMILHHRPESALAEFDRMNDRWSEMLVEYFDIRDASGDFVPAGEALMQLGHKMNIEANRLENEIRSEKGLELLPPVPPLRMNDAESIDAGAAIEELMDQIARALGFEDAADADQKVFGEQRVAPQIDRLFGPRTATDNDEKFPILGRPAIPSPKQPMAAEPTEPAPETPTDGRPDVPDVFDGIEINWLD